MSRKTRFKNEIRRLWGDDLYHSISRTRVSQKRANSYTVALRKRVCFQELPDVLYAAGHKLERPENLKAKHIEVILSDWERRGLQSTTAATYASSLRFMLRKLGKPHLEQMIAKWLKERREREDEAMREQIAASGGPPSGKSLMAKQVEIQEILDRVIEHDSLIALQLMLSYALGLRVRESHLLRPNDNWDRERQVVHITRGAKGGRTRTIDLTALDMDMQELTKLLEQACEVAERIGGSMIPEDYRERRWRSHYYYVLRVCGLTKKGLGVTAHGLRHERAQRIYAANTGEPAPVLSGVQSAELSQEEGVRTIRQKARSLLASVLGHGRVDVTRHYLDALAGRRKFRHTTMRGQYDIESRSRTSSANGAAAEAQGEGGRT